MTTCIHGRDPAESGRRCSRCDESDSMSQMTGLAEAADHASEALCEAANLIENAEVSALEFHGRANDFAHRLLRLPNLPEKAKTSEAMYLLADFAGVMESVTVCVKSLTKNDE